MRSASRFGSINTAIDNSVRTFHPCSSNNSGQYRSRARKDGSAKYRASSVKIATNSSSGTSGWPIASGICIPPNEPNRGTTRIPIRSSRCAKSANKLSAEASFSSANRTNSSTSNELSANFNKSNSKRSESRCSLEPSISYERKEDTTVKSERDADKICANKVMAFACEKRPKSWITLP